jgi:cytochrome P450
MPDVQEYLRDEIKANLEYGPTKKGKVLQLEELKRFTLLDAFVKETLRYFTLLGNVLIPRLARRDMKIGNIMVRKG